MVFEEVQILRKLITQELKGKDSGTYVVFIFPPTSSLPSPTYLLFSKREGGSQTETERREGGEKKIIINS